MNKELNANDAASGSQPLTLWGAHSVRAFRVHWMLLELGLAYSFIPARPRQETALEEFRSINPRGKVPVLQHGDLMLTESAAIVLYLAETFPAPGIYTAHDAISRARLNEWCFFVMTELDATSLYVLRRHEQLTHLFGDAPAAVDAARAYFAQQLSSMQDHIARGSDYLFGDVPSAADILLVSCLDWAQSVALHLPQELHSYHARAQQRPAYRQAHARTFPR